MPLDIDSCYRAVQARDARHDGRFFTCVTTTGVYCRPVCPARLPRRENCRFVPSAAAAQEAGFRPCLRCRPECAPRAAAWVGTAASVGRALSLIDEGALDEGDVERLAERVGVGGRQLRRLFAQHVGASPLSVAQTRRLLLARQLLIETDLSMAGVAAASGFGSVRRFNECFRSLEGRAPSALRSARRARASGGVAGALELTLGYRGPYDWDAMLAFLAARAVEGVERVDGDAYHRAFRVGGSVGTLRVAHAPARRGLAVRVVLSSMGDLPRVVARVRRVFDLSTDPDPVAVGLSADPVLASCVARRPGLRLPGAWDGFEAATRAILGQQVSVARAVGMLSGLARCAGEELPEALWRDGLTRLFPRPEAVREDDVRALGMPGARARALARVALAAKDDPSLFGPRACLDDALEVLRALPGVGDWTAQYVALRGMGEPDAFPASDAGLLRAWQAQTGERLSPAALRARVESLRPWRGYAAQQLWAADAAGESRAVARRKEPA